MCVCVRVDDDPLFVLGSDRLTFCWRGGTMAARLNATAQTWRLSRASLGGELPAPSRRQERPAFTANARRAITHMFRGAAVLAAHDLSSIGSGDVTTAERTFLLFSVVTVKRR